VMPARLKRSTGELGREANHAVFHNDGLYQIAGRLAQARRETGYNPPSLPVCGLAKG
jgi:hypothetical protein